MSEATSLAWMALRKERNYWGRKLKQAQKDKAPAEAIKVLEDRIRAIDDAMSQFEDKS